MAGRISEYIAAGKLIGTELMDLSVVDAGAASGYVTRKVTVDNFINDFPSFYTASGTITGNRTINQDAFSVYFNSGDWGVDFGSNGIMYDNLSKRVGFGAGTQLAKVHVKGSIGDDLMLIEDSTGVDLFLIDSSGDQTIKSSGGVQTTTYQTTGGNKSIIKNNSTGFEFFSVGVATVHGGNGAGAGIMVDGYLSAAQTYTNNNRRIQAVSNTNSIAEIVYFDFSSSTGVQTAKFGSSDAEESRFDTWDVYSEISTFHGDFNIVGSVVNMANLPVAAAGLAAGDLWNNAGVINIV